MKLVPLGDRVVLKQVEAEETNKVRYYSGKQISGKTTGSRSCCSRTWRNGRRQRSNHAGESRR